MKSSSQKRFQFSLKTLIAWCVAGGFSLLLGIGIYNFFTSGYFAPRRIIETLQNPVRVDAWDADGLILSSGEHLKLPNVAILYPGTIPLNEFLKQGVEQSIGRVFGIVKLWHWCGNDSCREHYARIDLGYLVEYCAAGELVEPLSADDMPPWVVTCRIGKSGWNISHYQMFMSWVETRKTIVAQMKKQPQEVPTATRSK